MSPHSFSDSDLTDVLDISIPLRFDGEQPNVYGVNPATSRPCEYGGFIGDTRRGGSVNFEEYTFVPHCSGTHTECVGHVTEERISVRSCLKDVFTEALLITVEPENAIQSGESYPYDLEANDEFISRRTLENIISQIQNGDSAQTPLTTNHRPPSTGRSSLVIRTLPNDDSKFARSYDKPVPPFFSNDAMEFIVECGFKHMLVDLPSIDRLYDDGKLSNHRIFWNVEPQSRQAGPETRIDSTITELIYVPDEIKDGQYLLNLQIAPFESDAAPSRPMLIKI